MIFIPAVQNGRRGVDIERRVARKQRRDIRGATFGLRLQIVELGGNSSVLQGAAHSRLDPG
jgi:hypothetical protein